MPGVCTLVTCYYPIRSKYPTAQYMNWARQFMMLAAPIVLFTTRELASVFRAMRLVPDAGPLTVVCMPFEELDAWVRYKDKWIATAAHDPETAHSPELYAIWAQKPFFVSRAIQLNPYKTDYFFWCDIGAFRTPIHPSVRASFPTTTHLPSMKILMSSVCPLDADDWAPRPDGIRGDFLRVNRIVGGLWGGGIAGCTRWQEAYCAMLDRYFAAGRFAGKDQSVMLSAYLEDPTLANIMKCTLPDIDIWFFLTHLCSERTDVVATLDPSYMPPANGPIISVRLLGGLGNQMFQIAAAYAHARRHGGRLQLLRNKTMEDGRATYWDSVLANCAPYVVDSLPDGLAIWDEPAGPTAYRALPAPPTNGLMLHGFYQSAHYFGDAADDVRQMFKASPAVLAHVRTHYGAVLDARDRVIVVSARRTDYLKNDWNIRFHGPLKTDYYARAISNIVRHVPDPIFVLCADDPLYWLEVIPCVPELQVNPFYVIADLDDVHSLALQQQFKHFVLANSTFSWWGAWLADAEHVVAPAAWFGPAGPSEYDAVYLPSWTRV